MVQVSRDADGFFKSNDPEAAVFRVAFRAFERLFIRLVPIILIGAEPFDTEENIKLLYILGYSSDFKISHLLSTNRLLENNNETQSDKTYIRMRYVLSAQKAEKCSCISPHFVL